jgi:hypothetical protein
LSVRHHNRNVDPNIFCAEVGEYPAECRIL